MASSSDDHVTASGSALVSAEMVISCAALLAAKADDRMPPLRRISMRLCGLQTAPRAPSQHARGRPAVRKPLVASLTSGASFCSRIVPARTAHWDGPRPSRPVMVLGGAYVPRAGYGAAGI
jgi:hypothetical protein